MADAPLYNDLAQGPDGGRAYWLTTSDGVRVRMALWPKGAKGTVLLLPGRTEYIEKYGQAAADFGARGFGVAVIDWRGQGLSDRQASEKMIGFIDDFSLYQNDLQALVDKLDELKQPEPFYLVSHSMGGCIGLRAVISGLRVRAAAFSAPMWGIHFGPGMAPVARFLSHSARTVGQGQRYAPGTSAKTYVATAAFSGNALTRDAAQFARMQAQAAARPELTLGGPSLHWVDAALQECRALSSLPSPDLPAICMLGGAEKLVDSAAVKRRMAGWPNGRLELIPQAEHEIMMEIPEVRTRFFDAAAALFEANP